MANSHLPSSNSEQPKVVLVTDWITKEGGGEKVVEQFHLTFPGAPIYTSYCADRWRSKLDDKVITGYLQHWPFSRLRRFLPVLRQWWFASLDLSDFDTIISITGNGEAKFAHRPKPSPVASSPVSSFQSPFPTCYTYSYGSGASARDTSRGGERAFNWAGGVGQDLFAEPVYS